MSRASENRSHHLLLDSRVVERAENARLVLGTVQKHAANPLFGEDRPWEKRFDNLYGNVIFDQDEGLYRFWYNLFTIDYSSQGMSLQERDTKPWGPPPDREMGVCYATSRDGLTWEKPSLGLVDYEGSAANNIVWRGPHGVGVFRDMREPDPGRRYKAIYQGLYARFSADGLDWGEPVTIEDVDVRGDTHNNALWAPTLDRYVGITRTWGERGREVARIESEDFVHWSPAGVVLEGVSKELQPYSMPVFFHGGVYLGLVVIHEQSTDRAWTELAWSPDTVDWQRISPGTPLIPCADEKLQYDYGCAYASAYPVFLADEIRLYYGGSDYLHTGWRNGFLCLATLRPDGFAGYEQESADRRAAITTVPISYSGQDFTINADVGEGGSVDATVLDEAGGVLSTAATVSRSVSDGVLQLDATIAAEKIRLRFELEDARLYSFGLGGPARYQ